jgi:hypothetical protein
LAVLKTGDGWLPRVVDRQRLRGGADAWDEIDSDHFDCMFKLIQIDFGIVRREVKGKSCFGEFDGTHTYDTIDTMGKLDKFIPKFWRN